MRKDIAVVQPCHGNLGNDHLQESRECREHAELVCIEAEAGGGGEVSAFHDPRGNENLWVFLVNHLQAGGTWGKATVNLCQLRLFPAVAPYLQDRCQ